MVRKWWKSGLRRNVAGNARHSAGIGIVDDRLHTRQKTDQEGQLVLIFKQERALQFLRAGIKIVGGHGTLKGDITALGSFCVQALRPLTCILRCRHITGVIFTQVFQFSFPGTGLRTVTGEQHHKRTGGIWRVYDT